MRNYQKKCHRRRITAVFFLCLGAVALALFCNFHQKTTMWEQPPGALEGTMPSSQTTISLQRSDGTVEELGLEDYLVGVLAAEVSPDFQEEALKAQAVAARTYTEAKLQAGYPLCDDYRCCQANYDEAQRRERWQEDFSAKESRLSQAVTETQGMVLCYEGALAKTYFHSTCGGKTASAEEVWGEAYPYLVSVDCSWDTDAPRYQETIELSPQEATAKLNDGVLRCTASPG
ncbi:MAG: SpoIID/LytB domain-containing protein, partial [Bacillota bacterium]|nr:SpoIID/LytB domain-containing protein [Bacillota bacterium]